MKVLKFGGTSVADSKSINNVISILKDNDEPLFIIVSALGGITNLLQKCIVSKGQSVDGIINEIEQRHLEVINNLSSLDKQSSLKSFLKQSLNELEDILDAISTIDEVTDKTISKVLTLGEILSSCIIYEILKQKGFDISYIDSRELIFTKEFNNSQVLDSNKTSISIKHKIGLIKSKLVIAPGYICSNEKGETSNLGRGGSDYSAAIYAKNLNAKVLEIWTDVSGVFTANPKIDENIQQKAFELSNLDNFIKLSEEELQKATDELRIIEEKEAGMLKFSREVESSRKLYESFLQRVKETNEAQNLQVSKLKVIETPNLPLSPFSPQPTKNFILAFLISFFGVYGLLYFREMNSSVIKSPEAIDSLNIPQIGILPRVEKLKRGYHILQMFVEDGASSFAEAIRSSRAIIESKFSKNRSYMVTSSNPSEGKTTYAFNLALSLEKANKVLFIEADIRRPSVLNGFYQFDREILGLGEIITGSAQLNEAIFKVPGTELDIITSGEKRFDMSDIVNKEQIKKFLDVLKLKYDYVIVDSPPVQPVSDTLILTQASDYNLFVIRSDETRTASFMSSIKKIQNVGAKINGIVINDLDTSKDSYYSYYYSYTPEYYTKS